MPLSVIAGAVQSQYVIQPLSTSPPPLPIGQTVLAIGIVPGLPTNTYNTPYYIRSIQSAGTYFGGGTRFTRALGELVRQGAQAIVAIVIPDETYLQNALDYLVDVEFGILVPVGLDANTPSRVTLLANYAYTREQVGRPITIVMQALDTNPNPGLGCPVIAASPAPIKTSRYFVFTVDQVVMNPNIPTQYTTDAAPSVAGLMSRLPAQVSITNETLRGVKIATKRTIQSQATLAANNFLVLRNSIRNGTVPYVGTTALANGAYLNNLATSRCTQYVATFLRSRTKELVGEPSQGLIVEIVDKALNDLQADGIILAYDYNVTVQQALGIVSINLSILPPYETQMINVYTRVNLQAA